MNTVCVLYVTWKQACFQLWLNINEAACYSWAVMGIPANSSSFPRSLQVFIKSPRLLVKVPNLPGNTYRGIFQFFPINFVILEMSKKENKTRGGFSALI